MARYDYRCPECGNQFEVEHPMSEHPTITCPKCGAVAQQVFGASSIVFKGSGFYNTDSRKGATSATSATSAPAESSGKESTGSKESAAPTTKSDD